MRSLCRPPSRLFNSRAATRPRGGAVNRGRLPGGRRPPAITGTDDRHASRSHGFTLIEVLVVVIIIGVLATMIIPSLFSRVGKAKQAVAKQKVATLEQAVGIFKVDYGRFPQSLDELVNRPPDIPGDKWNPPTVKQKDLADPWGNPWHYRYPGEHGEFDLSSDGADSQPGGEGENADVTNW